MARPEYGFEGLTTAPPNPRRIRFNNASAANTTALYIYTITAGRNDIRLILLDLPVGALLYIQDKNTSANFAKFFTTAPTIDRTTYIEVPVVAFASAGTIPNDGRALLYVSGSRRGVTDGSNAAAGMVGEYLSASNTTGSALTTDVALNVAALALTAGRLGRVGADHLYGGNQHRSFCAGHRHRPDFGCDANAGAARGRNRRDDANNSDLHLTQVVVNQIMQTGPDRYNSNAPQTVYLVSQATFGGGTLSVTGFISARRIRSRSMSDGSHRDHRPGQGHGAVRARMHRRGNRGAARAGRADRERGADAARVAGRSSARRRGRPRSPASSATPTAISSRSTMINLSETASNAMLDELSRLMDGGSIELLSAMARACGAAAVRSGGHGRGRRRDRVQ